MQVEAGESDSGAYSYRHLKTDCWKSGSEVTGRFAQR